MAPPGSLTTRAVEVGGPETAKYAVTGEGVPTPVVAVGVNAAVTTSVPPAAGTKVHAAVPFVFVRATAVHVPLGVALIDWPVSVNLTDPVGSTVPTVAFTVAVRVTFVHRGDRVGAADRRLGCEGDLGGFGPGGDGHGLRRARLPLCARDICECRCLCPPCAELDLECELGGAGRGHLAGAVQRRAIGPTVPGVASGDGLCVLQELVPAEGVCQCRCCRCSLGLRCPALVLHRRRQCQGDPDVLGRGCRSRNGERGLGRWRDQPSM